MEEKTNGVGEWKMAHCRSIEICLGMEIKSLNFQSSYDQFYMLL